MNYSEHLAKLFILLVDEFESYEQRVFDAIDYFDDNLPEIVLQADETVRKREEIRLKIDRLEREIHILNTQLDEIK